MPRVTVNNETMRAMSRPDLGLGEVLGEAICKRAEAYELEVKAKGIKTTANVELLDALRETGTEKAVVDGVGMVWLAVGKNNAINRGLLLKELGNAGIGTRQAKNIADKATKTKTFEYVSFKAEGGQG